MENLPPHLPKTHKIQKPRLKNIPLLITPVATNNSHAHLKTTPKKVVHEIMEDEMMTVKKE